MNFNKTQQEVVNHINGPLLCIAGPGSGKTTSIIGRVKNLVNNGITPSKILVVTFTKAAAEEMKTRYLKLEGSKEGPFFGTIHSLALKILKEYDQDKYQNSNILSEQDQRVFIRNQIRGLRIERVDQDAIINVIIAGISNVKNNELNPIDIEIDGCSSEQFAQIFQNYEDYKNEENKIDYDDMLVIAETILSENKNVLKFWRDTYSHLIIDEFQDTNKLQAKILYKIAYPQNNICVVGDDDQCQPAGTQVLLIDSTTKNIEDLVAGDKIMGYDPIDFQCMEDNIVEEIAVRNINNENLIRISLYDGTQTTYTANHRTYVKLNPNIISHSIYLIIKNNIYYLDSKLPDNNRYDKIWLLTTFEHSEDFEKHLTSAKEMLNNQDVEKLLRKYHRDIRYPLFDKDIDWLNKPELLFDNEIEIYATNIIEKYMNCIMVEENDICYDVIYKVEHEMCKEPTKVYSIKTKTQNYIADNIVTHNCIYRFRGAMPQIMLNFEKQFSGCKKVILNVNYRSEPEIVETSRRLIEKNKVRFEKPLESNKTGEANITYEVYKNRDKQISQIVKQIKGKQRKGQPLDEIAILYRTNAQAAQLIQALIKADIPFYTNEMIINIYDHWIFNDFKNFKKVVDNTCNLNEFLSIINRPNKFVSRKILPTTYSEDGIMKSVLRIGESWKQKKMKDSLEEWYGWIHEMETMTPYQFIETIRKNLKYEKYVNAYAEANNFDESQFIDIMDEIQEASKEFETFSEWYDFVEKELEEFRTKMKEKKKEDSVTLSTMHRSKGLEWNEVYIIDCNETITPYYKAGEQEDLEEERRMFYVAMTRARETLHICSIEKRNKKPIMVSRFVEEMKPPVKIHKAEQNVRGAVNKMQFKPNTWVFHKTFGNGLIVYVNNKQIQIAFSNVGIKTLDEQWCLENLQLF